MPSIAFRSPVAGTLHRFTWNRPAGNHDFRVTQRFDDEDYYWSKHGYPGRTHNATDIGSGDCGRYILAMAAGVAYRIHDNASALGAPNDALGVRVVHRDANPRIETEYWHFSKQVVAHGARVGAGARLGIHGGTGLAFGVCHCHVVLRVDGQLRDPEPYMFGAAFTFGEEQDVPTFSGSDFKHLALKAQALQGARFRTEPSTQTGEILLSLDAGEGVVIDKAVNGQAAAKVDLPPAEAPFGDRTWYVCWLYVPKRGYMLGFMHASTVRSVDRQVDNDAMRNAISRATTAIDGGLQAIETGSKTVSQALADLNK